jgi:hypothetical protein
MKRRGEKMAEKGADDVLLTLMSGSMSTIEHLQFAQTPPPIHSGLVASHVCLSVFFLFHVFELVVIQRRIAHLP